MVAPVFFLHKRVERSSVFGVDSAYTFFSPNSMLLCGRTLFCREVLSNVLSCNDFFLLMKFTFVDNASRLFELLSSVCPVPVGTESRGCLPFTLSPRLVVNGRLEAR